VQNTGNLAELPLEGILETVQRDRATGTLHLTTDQGQATLFFLFGHLFHAVSPEGDGEDVVIRAPAWRAGNFHFDPRAKLPAEETIKSSPAELIAAAEGDGEPATVAAGAGASGASSLRAIEGQGGTPSTAAAPAAACAGTRATIWYGRLSGLSSRGARVH